MIQGSHFDLASASKNLILTTLKSTQISKTARLDSLSGRVLKDEATFLAKPISDLCNLFIKSEIFIDLFKVVKLKPLYKKGSLAKPCNYSPISMLPIISKVIEKIIHNQTSIFLNSKNLLYTYQSGFRKKHSKDFCLSYLNDKIIKSFDKGLMTGTILIDLQKAFYTIDSDVLLQRKYTLLASRNIP